jgi:hypothetical protein
VRVLTQHLVIDRNQLIPGLLGEVSIALFDSFKGNAGQHQAAYGNHACVLAIFDGRQHALVFLGQLLQSD